MGKKTTTTVPVGKRVKFPRPPEKFIELMQAEAERDNVTLEYVVGKWMEAGERDSAKRHTATVLNVTTTTLPAGATVS